jgi:hypothetical protein
MNDGKELIDRYFDLAPRPDADAYFAQFADDAVVEDEGWPWSPAMSRPDAVPTVGCGPGGRTPGYALVRGTCPW